MKKSRLAQGVLVFVFFALTLSMGGQQELSSHSVPQVGGIRMDRAWVRPSPQAGGTSAGYMEILNSNATADRLLEARSAISSRVELHTHIMDGTVARMRRVEAINLPAGQTTELKPGGLHLMFSGLHKPLAEGDVVELILVFENAGELSLRVPVVKSGIGLTQR